MTRPFALAAACCLLNTLAAAHPISVTDATVYVQRERVAVRIDVFVEDLLLFHDLRPNDQDRLEPAEIRRGIEQHQRFLLERFVIRDAAGELLEGRLQGVQEFSIDPQGVPLAELMSHRLGFELEYQLPAPPEFLTFSQHLADQRLLAPAEMQLRVKQEGSETPYHQLLYPDQPQTIRFSWDHPPLSAGASQEEWDRWYARQQEETLGITSYSSVYSFLYIEDTEVRHELLVPLLTLEESVPISRADKNFLEVGEQDAAREAIAAWFTAGNPLEIDGQIVRARVDHVDFYGLEFKDFATRAERRRVSMASARVGLILEYRTAAPPRSVQLTWDRFHRYLWTVSMVVFAGRDAQRVTLSRVGGQNVYRWSGEPRALPPRLHPVAVQLPSGSTWRVPLLSLGCLLLLLPCCGWLKWRAAAASNYWFAIAFFACLAAAAWPCCRREVAAPFATAPRVDEDSARAIVTSLQANVYRAFGLRDEAAIYDALALSVDGPLLRSLYLQVRRGLEMQEQGGAVSRVEQVALEEGRIIDPPPGERGDSRAFGYECRWTVAGSVEHWGHVHQRTNQYQARFQIEPRHSTWKIVGINVLDERRVRFETRLRGW